MRIELVTCGGEYCRRVDAHGALARIRRPKCRASTPALGRDMRRHHRLDIHRSTLI
jgi:hypothetical protein